MDLWSLVKTFFLLIFILGLMYGAVYYVKKYYFSFDKKTSRNIKIRVLSTQMLMPKKFVQVVQVHDKVLVLGISDHSINLLQELDDLPVQEERIQSPTEIKDNLIQVLKKNLGIK